MSSSDRAKISEADLICVRRAIRDTDGRTFQSRTLAGSLDESPQWVGKRLGELRGRGLVETVTSSSPYRWRLADRDGGASDA